MRKRAWEVMAIAAWFGLVTGLLEGIARLALQGLGGVSWDLLLSGTSARILWAAPLFYLPLFTAGGALLAAASALAPRLPMKQAAVLLFGFVGFANVISSSGRVSTWGILALALGLSVVLLRWFNAHEAGALFFWKRSLVWLAAAGVLAFAGIEAGIHVAERRQIAALPPAAQGTPNVLVIVADTLGANHMSLYGYERKTSPNLERLAEQSVVFDNAVTPSPWTVPAHVSMLAGMYPCEHGSKKFGPESRLVLLPEVLQARGYRTGAFSANALFFSRAHGFGQGFHRFEDVMQNLPDMFARTLLGRKIERYLVVYFGMVHMLGRRQAEEINESAVQWLEQDRDRPFFAFLNYFDTHGPYTPPQPFRSAFSKKKNPGGKINTFAGRFVNMGPAESAELSPELLEDEIAAYDGGALYVDDQIGRLLGELEKRGLSENTIVVITSDHGELFREHGLIGHGTSVYRGLAWVPLMIRWPGKIPARRVETPVSLTGIPATIMSLLHANSAQPFPEASLAPLWSETSAAPAWPNPWSELAACPENKNPGLPCNNGELTSIVTRDWYFIYHEKLGAQLYDQKQDPQQLHDLAGTPEGQQVVRQFLSRIQPSHNHRLEQAKK